MCSRCGQHFPLVKLVVDVPEARVEDACEDCDRQRFFGHLECGHCGRSLDPLRLTH